MGGALKDIGSADQELVLARLEESMKAALEGDERIGSAFEELRVEIDYKEELRPVEEVYKQCLRAGREIDEERGRELAQILLGDLERLREG